MRNARSSSRHYARRALHARWPASWTNLLVAKLGTGRRRWPAAIDRNELPPVAVRRERQLEKPVGPRDTGLQVAHARSAKRRVEVTAASADDKRPDAAS